MLELVSDGKLRRLAVNMIYVGVAAKLLDIDMEEIRRAVVKQFKGKEKAVEINVKAIQGGYDWAAQNLTKKDPFRLERMNETAGKIIIEGNAASAIGAVMAGVTALAWYPITPSSSLAESVIEYAKRHRKDPVTGKPTCAIVQAEDELAAIGMVLGAGWAGARAMTTTSGPGISLMAEFVGLGYYAEVPAVIVDVQRVGPSTGLPTRTMQGDILSTYFLSHGDTKHVLLLPGSVEECYSLTVEAFDLAERLQTPVFVMTDLDLGMNNWMSEPFAYPEKPIDRGKVLRTGEEFKEHIRKFQEFARYRDVDGDGIAYRTLPGGIDSPAAAFFTRGSGHTERATYSERPDDYKNNMDRLARKFETARRLVPTARRGRPGLPDRRPRLRLVGFRRPGGAPAARPQGLCGSTRCACGRCLSRRKSSPSSRNTTASTSSTRTATARCTTCSAWRSRRATFRSCARSATTTASPSTPRR